MTRIDIWRESLADVDPPMHRLDPLTRRRADEFADPLARRRFLFGRVIVRAVLSTVTGLEADSLQLTYLPSGRPILVDRPSFSVSHSGPLILVAVAPTCLAAGVDEGVGTGVDVEQVGNVVGWRGAARRLPDQDSAGFARLPPKRGCAAFLRAWSAMRRR
jgi:4'-phosphopantetheinyl transferase